MLDVRLTHPTDFDGWRAHARCLIARHVTPDAVAWRVSDEPPDLFALASVPADVDAPVLFVPRRFVRLAETVICHRHPARFSVLYRLLWRMAQGERQLTAVLSDPDVNRAQTMAKSVRRDTHKMKAFVRFRSVHGTNGEHLIAWFEPQHFIVERAGPFFAQRFAGTRWSILTPDRSAHWDGEHLCYGPGTDTSAIPSEDALEEVWRRYYASIFNPSRVNVRAMKTQMPVRYWKNLPEAQVITRLVVGAGNRVPSLPLPPHRGDHHQAEADEEPRSIARELAPVCGHRGDKKAW